MPHAAARALACIPPNVLSPFKAAEKLHEVWPTALSTHLLAVMATDRGDYARARELFVRALSEPDPMPGLRAGRARLLAGICYREFRTANDRGLPRSDATREAARLAVRTMISAAGSVDVDRHYLFDLLLVSTELLDLGEDEPTVGPALWTYEDIVLAVQAILFTNLHKERVGLHKDLAGLEGRLFKIPWADELSYRAYKKWSEALDSDPQATSKDREIARTAAEQARRRVADRVRTGSPATDTKPVSPSDRKDGK